jgi:hypothetical protein
MKHIAVAIIITILALLLAGWAAIDTHAQGYENVCTCERFPVCWYTDASAPADWTWIPLWGQMLRWQVREFGAGWRCSHGIGR